MLRRGSFARDWNLIKATRTWHPHDMAGDVLERLLEDASEGMLSEVTDIAYRLGVEEGRRFLDRTPVGMDDASVLESYFLVSGIPCEVEEEEGGHKLLHIRKEKSSMFAVNPGMRRLSSAFVFGFVSAVTRRAAIEEEDSFILVRV
jgi:hypothetical protein